MKFLDKIIPFRNFKYLDNLIHSGIKEIVLDSDITLGYFEESKYLNGIKLDVDNLIIDGNGHTIDACGKTRIFQCSSKNIIIKNIHLKNGFTKKNGGAIYNNRGKLSITNSTFTNNLATRGGAICNEDGKIDINKSTLNNNSTVRVPSFGGAIFNMLGEMSITGSILNDNTAKSSRKITKDNILKFIITEDIVHEYGSGGAISNNFSKLIISESTLNKNIALSNSGAIENYGGDLIITKSTINENIVKNSGGAVDTVQGNLIITKSILKDNMAKGLNGKGGAIRSFKCEISIMESEFINNSAKKGGALYLIDSKHELDYCNFKTNIPDNTYEE